MEGKGEKRVLVSLGGVIHWLGRAGKPIQTGEYEGLERKRNVEKVH